MVSAAGGGTPAALFCRQAKAACGPRGLSPAPALHRGGDRSGQIHPAASAQPCVDLFQPLDQIPHFLARGRPPRGIAEMCPAAERPTFIDLAAVRLQEWTGPVRSFGHGGPARGTPCLGRDQCFPACEERGAPGETEAAAIAPAGTRALQRPLLPFVINRSRLGRGGTQSGIRFHGRSSLLMRRLRNSTLPWSNSKPMCPQPRGLRS